MKSFSPSFAPISVLFDLNGRPFGCCPVLAFDKDWHRRIDLPLTRPPGLNYVLKIRANCNQLFFLRYLNQFSVFIDKVYIFFRLGAVEIFISSDKTTKIIEEPEYIRIFQPITKLNIFTYLYSICMSY